MSPEPDIPELQPSITPNSFLHLPCPLSHRDPPTHSDSNRHVIFFIPGNPGLVSYYHTFLSLLADRSVSPATAECVVVGLSLGGFGVFAGTEAGAEGGAGMKRNGGRGGEFGFGFEEPGAGRGEGEERRDGRRRGWFSLREQIELTAARVGRVLEAVQRQRQRQRQRQSERRLRGDANGRRWKVILIGHSVGAYIALEVLRMHRERLASTPSADDGKEDAKNFDIKAAILLTPTIVDIALSPSGRIAAPLLRFIPGLPLLASLAARFLTRALPRRWLEMAVRTVMGRDAPDEAVTSTLSFLGSADGVRQSLEMARDEMREIREDRWEEEEVWGVVEAGREDCRERGEAGMGGPARLVFYFAHKDHWVADHTREAIISTRGEAGGCGRAKVVVAKAGELEHGWCIRHNGSVAKRVNDWVSEIMEK